MSRLPNSAAPRLTTSQQGMMPSGRRCSYFHFFRISDRVGEHGGGDVGCLRQRGCCDAEQASHHDFFCTVFFNFYKYYGSRLGAGWVANRRNSSSVNRRERVRKRRPVPLSSENMPPLPVTTSMISWVCSQYANCSSPM
ncbi:MAG: hypothetical protein JWQ01_482 [Massilia sp.]|nr:hypothetical protein [Massilia sp.]